jgi:hypothetical protein
MNEDIKSEAVSRRKALLLLGMSAAFSVADSLQTPALAQEAAPAGGATGTAGTTSTGGTRGRQRRQGRRSHRHERRTGRHERRHERRTGEPAGATAPAVQ